jgi:hypothetical protein
MTMEEIFVGKVISLPSPYFSQNWLFPRDPSSLVFLA